MPGVEIQNPSGFQVHDIQQKRGFIDLRADVEVGLSSGPPSLPSLLLWNKEGLGLFDAYAKGDSYYLLNKEIEILEERVSEITANIPTGSVMIELGCGSLQKTAFFLRALEKQKKHVQYYALDLSLEGLTTSLEALVGGLDSSGLVSINGLLGTYDDCVSWLGSQPDLGAPSAITFVWLGNSVSNVPHYSEASELLSQFQQACQVSGHNCQFLLAADGCEQASVVQDGYDPKNPDLQAFMLNGLRHANTVLGTEAFHVDDWYYDCEFVPLDNNLEMYYVPRRDVQVNIGGQSRATFHFREGQRVKAVCSGKWTKGLMTKMASLGGFQLNEVWGDRSGIYYFYHLTSGADASV